MGAAPWTDAESERAEELRKQKGWSQERLAEYLGVDRATVSRIENGREASGPIKRLLVQLQAESSEAAE